MNVPAIQSKISALVTGYGESLTMIRGGSPVTITALVQAVSSATVSQLASATSPSGTATHMTMTAQTAAVPAQTTEAGSGSAVAYNYQYPPLALYVDGLAEAVPQATDTFERDGASMQVQVVYTERLAGQPLLYVALAQYHT